MHDQKDLKNAGIANPTEAEINRTINERVERARSERLANDFYNQAKSLNLIYIILLEIKDLINHKNILLFSLLI